MASGIVESSSESSTSEQQSQHPGKEISRSKLVQRLLEASENLPAFVNDLLTTQAVIVSGTEAAGFLIERQQEQTFSLKPIAHIRPDQSTAEQRAAAIAAFQEILRPCVVQGKDGAVEIGVPDAMGEPQYCLVTLLRNEGQIVAVSAVITRCHDLEKARQRLISMQLVAGYFELYSLRRGADQARMIAEGHQSVLQLATSVATAEGFESAAMNLCNELALRTGAVRVSLGWMKGNNIRVKALSNTEKFDKKQELIVQLEKVMEECWDQDEIVQFDPDGNSSQNVTRSAAELSRAQGGNVVLSLPLRRQSEIEGVVTLEFAAKQVVSPQTANALAIAVDLLAPQLYDRFQNDRWLIVKTGQSIKHGAEATIGPKHMLAKVLIALAIGVGVFVSVFRWNYHVSAPFQFVPVEKYSICAPFEGYIRNVLVKPGDHVAANDVLVELDTKDLELKREEFQSRADALENEIAKDAADPTKRADEKIATDNRKEALAQVAYYDRQVEKGKIRAPHDGEIVRGDLTDKLGAPVKQGDVMMEIADRNDLRAEIAVNERDIQDLNVFADGKPLPGSHGFLATTSLPNERFPFKIDRIVPLGDAKEGSNVFTVYGTLEKKSELWRPGMIGEARIEVGHRRLVWVWTHRLIDFLRMKLWM